MRVLSDIHLKKEYHVLLKSAPGDVLSLTTRTTSTVKEIDLLNRIELAGIRDFNC
jgi:hypothetical protein